jgi:flavorubredoxin
MTKALVLYHSQEHGNTGLMAQAVAEGLREAGCDVTPWNTNEGRFDATTFPQYDCAAFGSPDYYSYVAGMMKQFMDDHYILDVRQGMQGLKNKPYALFCSHGGGGRVKDVMVGLFKRVGTQVGELVASQRTPDKATLARCRALGEALAAAAAAK